jgi:prolyl 4-hydroxylase
MTEDTASVAPELRERIVAAACSGLGPDAALQPLIDHGWDRERAAEVVEEILTKFVAEQARAQSLPPPSRAPSPVGLNGPGVLQVLDRTVHVLTHLRHPRVVVFGGLLADGECKALMALARGTLTPSRVVDAHTGTAELHAGRSSEGTYFLRDANPLIQRIERRIAALTAWPLDHTEGLQVLRYCPGTQYTPHYDYFDPREAGTVAHVSNGGQRVASLVMYLNTPAIGGATVFPDAGLEVAAVRGNAVFFSYNMPHPVSKTLHGGAPVIEGEKWIATKWFRERACA